MGQVGCCRLPAAPSHPLQWRGLGFNAAAPQNLSISVGLSPLPGFAPPQLFPYPPNTL